MVTSRTMGRRGTPPRRCVPFTWLSAFHAIPSLHAIVHGPLRRLTMLRHHGRARRSARTVRRWLRARTQHGQRTVPCQPLSTQPQFLLLPYAFAPRFLCTLCVHVFVCSPSHTQTRGSACTLGAQAVLDDWEAMLDAPPSVPAGPTAVAATTTPSSRPVALTVTPSAPAAAKPAAGEKRASGTKQSGASTSLPATPVVSPTAGLSAAAAAAAAAVAGLGLGPMAAAPRSEPVQYVRSVVACMHRGACFVVERPQRVA